MASVQDPKSSVDRSDDTVVAVATRLHIDVDSLLSKIKAAGLPHQSPSDPFSRNDMQVLEQHLISVQKRTAQAGGNVVSRATNTGTVRAQREATRQKETADRSGSSRPVGTLSVQRKVGNQVKVATVKRRRLVKPASSTTATAPTTQKTAESTPTEVATEEMQGSRATTAETAVSPPKETRKKATQGEPSQLELEKLKIHSDEEKRREAEDEIRRTQQERVAAAQAKESARQARIERQKKAQAEAKAAKAQELAETERLRKEAEEARLKSELGERSTTRRGKDERGRQSKKTLDVRDLSNRRRPERNKGTARSRERKRIAAMEIEKHGGEFSKPVERVIREVEVSNAVSVGELARRMSVKASMVIKTLMNMGEMVTINQTIDQDTAVLVIEEMGHRPKLISSDPMEEELELAQQAEGEIKPRPPVITIMGHVDHGKTSLLDYIRKTQVVDDEHGGITQHIGAYHVSTDHGSMTFLDTPGHAVFSAMRARGANATDIVVLVCAADDGVMPQTQEAVQHAKAAKVPIVVAVNKIDVAGANPENVRTELSALDVAPDDWGGDSPFVNVSAKTGEGVEDLLAAIALVAEVEEFTAVSEGAAKGIVIESKLDRGRGPVATLLVQSGRLKKGDVVLAGECHGKVRSLVDERGSTVAEVTPSIPAEILGLGGVPRAGDVFHVAIDEKQARQLATVRASKNQKQNSAIQQSKRLESMFAAIGRGEKRILKIVVKTDVRGTLEAITQACADIGNDEVAVQILGSGVGGITESDSNLAVTYDAMIFGFNVRVDNAAKKVVDQHGLEVRYYNIIYELLDDIKKILEDMLVPELREEIVGTAEVRDVFHSPRFGQIAGCRVVEGTVFRNKKIRVLRDSTVIFEGELESLRRFKDDVQEVKNGFECGIGVRNYNDVREGDRIEVFEAHEVARAL